MNVQRVAALIRSDAKYREISGSIVYVGSAAWDGPTSRANFTRCGVVPKGLTPGQRVVVTCAGSGVAGNRVAIYLPRSKKSLVLCEVDVAGSVIVAKRKRTGRKLKKRA